MSPLTREEREIIAEYPLGGSLDQVREALHDAVHVNASRAHHDDPEHGPDADAGTDVPAPARPKLYATVMNGLLGAFAASMAAVLLASRTGKDSLGNDLDQIRRGLLKGNLEYQHLQPLSQLVVTQASDATLWAAVVALVETIARTTPPLSVHPSRDDTPVTHSSASQQGSEQTRRKLEARILDEVRPCTYQDVEGFHAKYFEHQSWSPRADRVWRSARALYHGRWDGFPDPPAQDAVYAWWFHLQDRLLARVGSAYYKSELGDMAGGEAPRQIDLIVKQRTRGTPEGQHHWSEVAVIGELKSSMYDWRGTLLQIGRYVRDVFAHQPTRRFVHAFALYGSQIETWIFDRSGPYSATTFDIHQQPERFIQILCGYVMMSAEELGLDTFVERPAGKLRVTLPDATGTPRRLELHPAPIAHQRAIVCRGTTCYRAKAARTTGDSCVVKFSWTSDKRPPETDLLQLAHARGVQGLARLVGHQRVTSIAEMRHGLHFAKRHRFRAAPLGASASASASHAPPPPPSPSGAEREDRISGPEPRKRRAAPATSGQSKRSRSGSQRSGPERGASGAGPPRTSLMQANDDPFDNRILRVLAIAPAGRSIRQFTSPAELVGTLRDAIRAHRSLYLDGQILHRDVSENNIIITDPATADGFRGMLIDLDLAKEVGTGPSGARHRTGTLHFMAIQVLRGFAHTYRHDLESFFYVLVWLSARKGWDVMEKSLAASRLAGWYTGSYDEMAINKRGYMDKQAFEEILWEFPSTWRSVKHLCRTLRDLLFPYRDGLFTGTPEDPESLYAPMGQAFDATLSAILEEE